MSVITLYQCDLCAREVFESRAALQRHVAQRHSEVVPDSADLAKLTDQLRPVFGELLEKQADTKWRRWGAMTFRVASKRDAGPARLAEACEARKQLEAVVRRWRPTASVYVFGSSVAMSVWDGLSDIDFTVIDVDAMDNGEWPPDEKNAVRGVASHLRRIGFSHPYLESVEFARVPIIKHTAPSAFASGADDHAASSSSPSSSSSSSVSEKFEQVLCRSVRFLFDSILDEKEMAAVEESVTEKLGGTAPERVWWEVSSNQHTMGVTAPTTTQAMQLLMSPPSSTTSNAMSNNSGNSGNNNKKNSGKTPPPLIKRKVPVAALPVHNELRPELFRIDFDLSFRAFGVRNSILLRHYLVDCGFVCARPGALVLKDWSKTSGVNNSMHGYLTSYAVNILWIYFLVQKGLVDFKDPQAIPESVRDVAPEPGYVPMIPKSIADSATGEAELHAQMGKLLVEFFAYYVFTFDWQNNVVSLNRPGVTTKQMLRWGAGNETTLTPGGGRGAGGAKHTRYDLCIEDPYEDNLNLGRHIGAVRMRKFLDEFKRALLALVKGDFGDSCVFPSSVAAAVLAEEEEKKQQQQQQQQGEGGAVSAEPKSSKLQNSSAAVSSTSDLSELLTVALQVLERSNDNCTTTEELRGAFIERAPDAFERVRNSVGWLPLTRTLGLRVVGDVIRPFRSVSAMRKKDNISKAQQQQQQQADQQQSQQQQQLSPQQQGAATMTEKVVPPEHRRETDFVSLDLSDRVLATFLQDASLEKVNLLPDWMKRPMAQSTVGGGGGRAGSDGAGPRDPPVVKSGGGDSSGGGHVALSSLAQQRRKPVAVASLLKKCLVVARRPPFFI